MSDNSDIDVDIISLRVSDTRKSRRSKYGLRSTRRTSTYSDIDSQETVSDTLELTKETRKLRKKKVLTSDDEDIKAKPSRRKTVAEEKVKIESPPPTIEAAEVSEVFEREFSDDTDDIDTDDLLDEVDQLQPIKNTFSSRSRKNTKSKGKGRVTPAVPVKTSNKPPDYDPAIVQELNKKYPDSYWTFHADSGYNMIDRINVDNPLEPLSFNISDQGAITGMTLSPDGTLLATFSNIGSIKIWDIQDDFRCIRKIRDTAETQIDEFYCGKFVSDGLLVTGGKLKDRYRWSAEDGDSHILPCPIKIFQLDDCKRVAKLEGHSEEILCIKALTFKGQNYYISTSQDGYIIKWHMADDWITLLDSSPMIDGATCMAFTISFVPNTGNKYFIAACDEHLRLYDFENAILMQTFEDMYSSYCDCGKFVQWIDQGQLTQNGPAAITQEEMDEIMEDIDIDIDVVQVEEADEKELADPDVNYAWFISRGSEMCDVSEGVSSKPNTCTLHKLIYPTEKGGKFTLEMVKKYSHESYHANSWLVKITSNGRYILAPTIYGQIFVFNMLSGQVTSIIKEHEDLEVRDVIFHPYMPLIFSSGDDGYVKVYTYK
ncbi:WD40-repeat-containing domain protein [Pilobolus umbonatus]|nr:WD40-repeat-containing domain protein [Pilobolus umbonatus]